MIRIDAPVWFIYLVLAVPVAQLTAFYNGLMCCKNGSAAGFQVSLMHMHAQGLKWIYQVAKKSKIFLQKQYNQLKRKQILASYRVDAKICAHSALRAACGSVHRVIHRKCGAPAAVLVQSHA
jgi:hypothetical protein